MSDTAGVAAGHSLSAESAAEILRAGGNAFDAAIGAIATACTCEPVLASPGGGGFCTVLTAAGEALTYDFFVQTPRRKTVDGESFYPVEVDFGDAQQTFHIGLGASATPGLIKGLFAIHEDLGRMPLGEVFANAIEHGKKGVELSAFQAYLLSIVGPIYVATPQAREIFCSGEKREQLAGERDVLHFSALAELFEMLAIEGADLFYRGEIAAAIVEQCESGGGHLRRTDLTGYDVIRRQPLSIDYRDYRFSTNPPPSSGGLLIGFALKLLENGLHGSTEHASAAHMQLLAEVMNATQKARIDNELADNSGRPLDLLDPDYLASYQNEIADRSAALRGTTHVSVIDRQGNQAALTVTNGEGCGHIVPGGGFMLNNMLGEDDLNPLGFGNWRCDERMTSMMAPGILQHRHSSRSWAIGSGGSNRIRSAILQVLSNLVDFALPVERAVAAPRIHLENDLLSIESGFDENVVDRLTDEFPNHTLWSGQNMFFGGTHTVERDDSGAVGGAADTRRGGHFIAF